MLVIKVELWPHGDDSRSRQLAHMKIANDGTGTAAVGNYVAAMEAEYGVRSGRITGFNRQTQSVWSLVGAALKLFGHTKHSPKNLHKHSPTTTDN